MLFIIIITLIIIYRKKIILSMYNGKTKVNVNVKCYIDTQIKMLFRYKF